ncbi:MAG: LacI family DNA-binding transcriptional regulator [Lachnospiraceae bacterium]|nr:LacI family DNA-binding transcriptional regulator [Lachnospiraceae bacterium]
MASIKDVAKEAGVSISTVSKVLKNYPRISEETRKKVNKAIKNLHYVPNAAAATLSSKRSGRVALLLNLRTGRQAIDEIDMQYISGAIEEAVKEKLDVITLFFSMVKDKSVQELIDYLHSQSIEGIIVYGIEKEDEVISGLVASQEFKMVMVDAPVVNETTSCIWVNQSKAQYEVAKKTITENLGPKEQVLYIAGDEDAYVTKERLSGIMKLQKELGFKLKVECGEFSEMKARQIAINHARDVDIIVCATDTMAIGAMKALVDEDVFHPVCGFGGVALMAYAGKLMNTISIPFKENSAEAVRELSRLLKGEEGRKIETPYELTKLHYLDLIK